MPRYIDVDKIRLMAIGAVDGDCDVIVSLRDVRNAILQTPAEDVVEVVRCKDCEHFYQVGDVRICRHWNYHSTKDDAYCSCAKMKGGAE